MDESVEKTENKLTERQEEYLLFFAARHGMGKGVSDVAQNFGVSKASASVACTALAKWGMILKPEQGGVVVTDQGWDYIQEKLWIARKVANCLTEKLGLLPYEAESEARKMAVSLQAKTIEAMLQAWGYSDEPSERQFNRERSTPMEQMPDSDNEGQLNQLEYGSYQVAFEVRKVGKRERSMGDRGFLKPAELSFQEDYSAFYLRTSKFSYQPLHRKLLSGTLERLWYQVGDTWHESCETEGGYYAIPLEAVRYLWDEDGPMGQIRIRARASVGLRKMPESEADLTFYMKDLRKKESVFPYIRNGEYDLPFTIQNVEKHDLNIKDQIFANPSQLIVMEHSSMIRLDPKIMGMQTKRKKDLVGVTDRLWYQADGNWYECKRSDSGYFSVPDSAVYVRKDENTYVGIVHVRARINAGMHKMPESEADIVFNLEQLQEKK